MFNGIKPADSVDQSLDVVGGDFGVQDRLEGFSPDQLQQNASIRMPPQNNEMIRRRSLEDKWGAQSVSGQSLGDRQISNRYDSWQDQVTPPKKKTLGERIQQFVTPKRLCILGGVGLLTLSLVGTIATGGLLAGVMAAATLACYGAIGVGGFKIAKKMFNSYSSPDHSTHRNEPSSDWKMNQERLLQDAYNRGYNKSQSEYEAAYNEEMYKQQQERYPPSDGSSVHSAPYEDNYNDRLHDRRQSILDQTKKDDEARRLNEQRMHQSQVS